MEILYAIAIAGVIGVVLRYVFPGRHAYGIALTPAVSAAAAAAAWGALAWVGWTSGIGWIWTISLGAGFVAAMLVVVLAPRIRRAQDHAYFERARRS